MSDPLAQLGLDLALDDGDIVVDAVLVMKVHQPDGSTVVALRTTEGTDWITRRGLVAIATDMESTGYIRPDD